MASESSPVPQYIEMPGNELAAVIFGCTKKTMDECIDSNLFGLPFNHMKYVQSITPGMLLFLFNYTDRLLHGIFRATSAGTLNINPHVSVERLDHCRPLSEPQYNPLLQGTVVAGGSTKHIYRFSLDAPSVERLCAAFQAQRLPGTKPLAASGPMTPATATATTTAPGYRRLQQGEQGSASASGSPSPVFVFGAPRPSSGNSNGATAGPGAVDKQAGRGMQSNGSATATQAASAGIPGAAGNATRGGATRDGGGGGGAAGAVGGGRAAAAGSGAPGGAAAGVAPGGSGSSAGIGTTKAMMDRSSTAAPSHGQPLKGAPNSAGASVAGGSGATPVGDMPGEAPVASTGVAGAASTSNEEILVAELRRAWEPMREAMQAHVTTALERAGPALRQQIMGELGPTLEQLRREAAELRARVETAERSLAEAQRQQQQQELWQQQQPPPQQPLASGVSVGAPGWPPTGVPAAGVAASIPPAHAALAVPGSPARYPVVVSPVAPVAAVYKAPVAPVVHQNGRPQESAAAANMESLSISDDDLLSHIQDD
eukprot:jgi/Mesvir1/18012/Mv25050-RA.2